MAARHDFLQRVRLAAAAGRQYQAHVQHLPADVGYVGVGGDLVQRFCEEITSVGGQPFVASSIDDARRKLRDLLSEAKAQSAVYWRHPVLKRIELASLLSEANIEAWDYDRLSGLPADEQRRHLLACDVGITSCQAAIAETGTLMMCSRQGNERLASLIAPAHIAVVERSQIVPDLIDAFRLLDMTDGAAAVTNQISNLQSQIADLPSNVTFITGPSKTGDIELQLTTGVHGPGVWQVIVIDDPATA